jgi:hypothetical protein
MNNQIQVVNYSEAVKRLSLDYHNQESTWALHYWQLRDRNLPEEQNAQR